MSTLKRANILLNQDRPAEAEKELRGWLAQNPQDDRAHAFLARALFYQDRIGEAIETARDAIALDPNDEYNHRIHARALQFADRADEALESADEAIRLDPDEPQAYYLKSLLLLGKSESEPALEAITHALAIKPEDVDFLALHAMVLNTQCRAAEARAAAESALQYDPESSDALTELGWAQLQANQPNEAIASFKEALRLEPDSERARNGIVESLKARIPVYRVVLSYGFWLASKSSSNQWKFIIGFYIAGKILALLARHNEALRPVVYPLLGLYLLFIFLTWTASSLCTLLIRLHPIGKHALTADEKRASTLVGLLLLTCLTMGTTSFFLKSAPLLVGGFAGLLYMLPLSGLFRRDPGPLRTKMAVFVGAIGLCGLSALGSALTGSTKPGMTAVYVLGCLLYSWLHNILQRK